MFVESCTFTIHFPANQAIREKFFQLESHFSDFQKPFTLVPLPPDAPLEIPRIIAMSAHGHSQLTICGNNAQLATRFDENYGFDVKKCIEYVQTKCNSIVTALSVISGNSTDTPTFYYSGLSLVILLDERDGIVDPAQYISEKFLKCKTNLSTDEVQFRLALAVEGKYYANISMQNNRTFLGKPDERGSIANLKIAKESVQVVLDVNDRYAFNYTKGYVSSIDTVNDVAKLTEVLASKHVADFVARGELTYDLQ